jgi:hypothetical protein
VASPKYEKKRCQVCVACLAENASSFQKRQYKNGGQMTSVQRNIDIDIRHGVTQDEVIVFLDYLAYPDPDYGNGTMIV